MFSGEIVKVNPRIQLTAAFVVILLICRLSQAEVIRTVLTFAPNVVGSWSPVDFNNDGVVDVSFNSSAISTFDPSSSVTFFLNVAGNGNNQVLTQSGSVLPLGSGATLSLTPVLGSWQNANSGPNVWTQPGGSGQLIGMGSSGAGNFMGVKFEINSDWHYGWIRFGVINNPDSSLPVPPWPSVLEFGYETIANTAILTPVPEPNSTRLAILFTVFAVGKKLLSQRQLTT